MSLLRIESIYAGYGKKEVLRSVSLHLEEGEVITLIGPNGAGKSTLLKVLAGFLKPFSGKVIFEDIEITPLPSFKRPSLGLLFLMQGGKVFPNLTVRENLQISIASNWKGLRLEEIFEIFPEMKNWLKIRAGLLSGGQKQQLALAMILLKKPKVMLLDEPSAGLSPNLVSEIMSKIKDINAIYKTGIILVEQNVSEALKISDRTYIMINGIIMGESKSSKELLEGETLERVFFGELRDGDKK